MLHMATRVSVRWLPRAAFAQALAAALSAAFLLRPTPGQADRYVGPGGEDGTNTCEDALYPCGSLAHVINVISNSSAQGDIIHLAAGTYTEPELSFDGLYSQNLTVRGAGPTQTIVQADATPGTAGHRVLRVNTGATSTVQQLTIRHGRSADGAGDGAAGENGGGIFVNGTLYLSNVWVMANETGGGGFSITGAAGRAGDGGGIYNDGTLIMRACWVTDNRTGNGGNGGLAGGRGGHGAGLCNAGGAVSMESSTFSTNGAGDGGSGAPGGLGGRAGIWNSGVMAVHNSTVSGNRSGQGGPGGAAAGGAGGGGGGIWNAVAATLALSNTTVTLNGAGSGGTGTPAGTPGPGGGLAIEGGTAGLRHGIVAGNFVAGGAEGTDVYGAIESWGYNLFEATNGLALGGSLTGVQVETDPELGPLAAADGSIPVHLPRFGSPVVNAGDPDFASPPDLDQRGYPRVISSAIDLGAVELPNTTLYLAPDGSDGTNECRDALAPCATIAHGVALALSGDVIILATGTYGAVEVMLDKNLAMSGQGAASTILEAAADPLSATSRVLHVMLTSTSSLQGLTVRHGRAADGADGQAQGESGGAGADGGGILNHGLLLLDSCAVISNSAGAGGQGETEGGGGGAGGSGGGIFSDGTLVLSNTLVGGNSAGSGGDGGDGASGGAGGSGGGLYGAGFLRVVNGMITGNSAGDGGDGPEDGGGGGDGGGIRSNGGLEFDRTELAGNHAGDGGSGSTGGTGGSGGGLTTGGPARADDSTWAGNAAGAGGAGDEGQEGEGGSGGGIQNDDSLVMVQCTVSGNAAGDAAGGATAGGGTGGGVGSGNLLVMSNCTVSGNSAGLPDGGGGGLFNAAGTVALSMTLVGDNAAPGQGPDILGDVDSRGYNLVEDAGDANLTNDLTGNVTGTDPQLGALALEGGTVRVVPLQAGSPALDAGLPGFSGAPLADQRGQPRVEGGRIDIGSYERLNPDDDGDGMPDDWEILYNLDPYDDGSTNALLGPTGDGDGDTFDNLSEFIAATAPDLAPSYFRIGRIQRTNAVGISYMGATGRVYSLLSSEGFPPDWTVVTGQLDIPGSGSTNTLTDPGPGTNRHYRISVRLP
jgi:hypothetical protein